MSAHYCRGEDCGHCQRAISAAEDERDGARYDPDEADQAADRHERSLER